MNQNHFQLHPILINLLDALLFSSVFIAVCAVLMSYQTFIIFTNQINIYYLAFVFFATLCSYNFHWYLTPASVQQSPRSVWSLQHKQMLIILTVLGLAGLFYFFLYLRQYWIWLSISAFVTFLYTAPKISFFNQLQKIAVGKTIFLSLVWTHVTCILPLVISGVEWHRQQYFFIINRFFFIYAICILFDFRDRQEDKVAGIKSMITQLNEGSINKLFWGSALIAAASLLFMLNYFMVKVVLAFALPLVVLIIVFSPAKRNFSDYLFYFVLDGLMMLSALLLLIFQF
ncbi:MAG: hypothetical protein ICV66_04715 [Chitinophagaceae bacterium]|nr:hypothetical protein [Chitinophagaceae bacterium]